MRVNLRVASRFPQLPICLQGRPATLSPGFRAIRGEFDAVVAMYHDQGHIPIKTHGFERSVTVTLGLSIVRTSVDHGTAFDIAYQGGPPSWSPPQTG